MRGEIGLFIFVVGVYRVLFCVGFWGYRGDLYMGFVFREFIFGKERRILRR